MMTSSDKFISPDNPLPNSSHKQTRLATAQLLDILDKPMDVVWGERFLRRRATSKRQQGRAREG